MRRIMPLNGLWYFLESPFGNRKVTVRDWRPVHVPACWNSYAPHLAKYEGVAWFQREFTPPPGRRYRLDFQGVNYRCEVFVNEAPAGSHEGGYTPFSLDISRWVRPGRINTLRVKADNSRPDMLVPPTFHGWFNYGGIYRDVQLVAYDRALIENVRIVAEPRNLREGKADHAAIRVTPSLVGQVPRGRAIRVTLRREGQNRVLASATSRGGQVSLDLQAPELWSPEHPVLYHAEIELLTTRGVEDRLIQTFGIRTVEFRKQGFFLNGQQVFLRGINRHDDYPTTLRAVDPDILALDIQLLKEMGANAVRLAHYPHDKRVIELCDRHGLLVWSEIPVYWGVRTDTRTRALAAHMAEEMVRRDWNNPSVVFWSVYNEISSHRKEYRPLVAAAAKAVRRLDSTRLVTGASCYIAGKKRGDVCLKELDVIGLNTYPAWYATQGIKVQATRQGFAVPPLDLRHFDDSLRRMRRRVKGPFLLSEFGAEGILGYRAKDKPKYSEDYQAHALERQFEVIRRYPDVAGVFVWLLADFPDPSRQESCFNVDINCKGVVDYGRRKKDAFHVLKRLYTSGFSPKK